MNPQKPNQRVGSVSNAHVGTDFESVAMEYFASKGTSLERHFPIELGVTETKKIHCFDLGSKSARILIECKSHRWTVGGRVPSAKMAVWNEAMYYFHLAPAGYHKVLFVLHDRREKQGEMIVSVEEFNGQLRRKAGQKVSIAILRKGAPKTIELQLGQLRAAR